MGWYAIHGFESTYGGMHGLEDMGIYECADEDTANQIITDMAWDLKESYADLDEIEDDDFEPDGEVLFLAESLTDKQRSYLDEMVNQDGFELFRDNIQENGLTFYL